MNVVQTIDMMTTAEKILAMEKIWDDLCRTENVVSSPSWHDEVLRAREKMIEVGEDRFVDWNAAKRDIKRKLS